MKIILQYTVRVKSSYLIFLMNNYFDIVCRKRIFKEIFEVRLLYVSNSSNVMERLVAQMFLKKSERAALLWRLYPNDVVKALTCLIYNIITARKRSLGQGYIFTGVCHSVNRGGAPLPLCQGDQTHHGDSPSRPTPRGEIEGDQVQAHNQGGNSGGSDPGPHPRGKFRGIRTRHPPPPKRTTAAGGTHPTGMHSCLYLYFGNIASFSVNKAERSS